MAKRLAKRRDRDPLVGSLFTRVLLAGDAKAREEYVAGSYRAYTPGDAVWPVMSAGDIPVYWKPPI